MSVQSRNDVLDNIRAVGDGMPGDLDPTLPSLVMSPSHQDEVSPDAHGPLGGHPEGFHDLGASEDFFQPGPSALHREAERLANANRHEF